MRLEVFRFEAMTTPCEVQIFSNDRIKANICAKEILHECKRLEKKYSYYNSDSYLTALNNRVENLIDNETKFLLQRAKQYYKKTNGIFDITIATIKELYSLETLLEFEEKKEFLNQFVGCEYFEIKKDKISFFNDFTKIDLGGFVKEYAVDRAVMILKKHKIYSALVNFGGDIYVLGKKPNKQKFKIAVKNPKEKDNNLFFVELENQALTTSASYERNYKIEHKNFSHIFSKESINNRVLSASVVSSSCVESGVFSTALMVDENIKTNHEKYLILDNLEIER